MCLKCQNICQNCTEKSHIPAPREQILSWEVQCYHELNNSCEIVTTNYIIQSAIIIEIWSYFFSFVLITCLCVFWVWKLHQLVINEIYSDALCNFLVIICPKGNKIAVSTLWPKKSHLKSSIVNYRNIKFRKSSFCSFLLLFHWRPNTVLNTRWWIGEAVTSPGWSLDCASYHYIVNNGFLNNHEHHGRETRTR